MRRQRFWTSVPSHRNALRLFEDEWASDLGEIEPEEPHVGVPLFKHDLRPRQAAIALGSAGRLDGMRILELGPLEGAHSFQLEGLGADSVLAIEANADAFLRCLVIKNMLALDRTTFLLGDGVEFLVADTSRYDMIFASGILYHMEDPLRLIALLARRTDKVFLWSMYFDPAYVGPNGRKLSHKLVALAHEGFAADGYEVVNHGRFRRDFWGGNRRLARWLSLDAILGAFHHHGMTRAEVIETTDIGGRGPAATIAFSRPASEV